MQRMLKLFGIVGLMVLLLAACGGTEATTPTAAPTTGAASEQPTAAPTTGAASEQPTAAPTTGAASEQPTAAPATTGGTTGPTITGDVTLWHAYGNGSAEEAAINTIIEQIKAANPGANITLLSVPFDQIFNKFETEAAAGGGPDMFIAPNDNLGNQVRADLLMPLDEKLAGKLDNMLPVAVEGCVVDGKLYCVPESLKAVALFYNKDKVKDVPQTTDELLAAVKGGLKLGLNQSAYHNFGFFPAFGGQLLDESGKCVADQGGFAEALQYLKDLKAAGAQFYADGGKANNEFQQGKLDAIINGPWATGDYKKDLGDKLGAAALPAGPKGPAAPLTGTDGFYINASAKNPDGAVALALNLVSGAPAQIYVEQAGHIPADKTVTVTDPITKGFADATISGFPRPQSQEFGNWWTPFGDAVNKVIDADADPAATVAEACTAMNAASGK